MVAAIPTPFGYPIPPYTPHAITTHATGWTVIEEFLKADPEFMARLKTIYPRFGPFNHTKDLIVAIIPNLPPGHMCLLFPNRNSAEACKDFITSTDRKEEAVDGKDVSVKAFDFHVRIYATVFPAQYTKTAIPFWQDPGAAVSTRLAEDCLKHVHELREADIDSEAPQQPTTPAFNILKTRITELLERAPASKHDKDDKKVTAEDVYLFQTGMAAIYLPHLYLDATRPGTTILYGFAFHSTPHVFERFSSNRAHFKWFARGGDTELPALESFIESERAAGRTIQALWAEYPTNPNLTTPSLSKLRTIADTHDFPLIIDDTISSFANVDLLGKSGADALISSLTKSFSGYADVMAGSIVLNPSSTHYPALKSMFDKHYTNDLYSADAEILERNSRDYLARTSILNRNAASLASFLAAPAHSHLVKQIHYPSLLPDSKANYDPYLRPSTPELPNPGYGCLLSIEFQNLDATIAFFNNINTHCSPHLGAHRTLTLPYNRLLIEMAKSEEVLVEKGGMGAHWIRVSVGLEHEADLLAVFAEALDKASLVLKDGDGADDRGKDKDKDKDGIAVADAVDGNVNGENGEDGTATTEQKEAVEEAAVLAGATAT